jgi:hypothetical protein
MKSDTDARTRPEQVGSGAARPQPAAPGSPSNPIVAALHEMAASVLSEQLREMFEKADDILFDSAEKARNGSEQQLYYDTMRTVRIQRAKIMTSFRASLHEALLRISQEQDEAHTETGSLDATKMALMDRETVEELIAVRNMETKASALHSHELVELQRRLARLADMTEGGLSPESMSPARIIRAFQNSIQGLSVDFPIKLVIFKLFDRLVVGRLSEVIAAANQLLARHGVEQKSEYRKPVSGSGSGGAKPGKPKSITAAPSHGGVPAAGEPAPAWASGVDAAMFDQVMGLTGLMSAQLGSEGGAAGGAPMFGGESGSPAAAWGSAGLGEGGAPSAWSAGRSTGTSGYNDGSLARDVSNILSALADGRWPIAPAWLPAPNVALVSRMFDAYYRDPRLTEKAKPMLARMQLPVIKQALTDPTFFTDTGHPARRASNDLFEILLQFSAAGSTASPQAFQDLEGLVRSMVQALDKDPAKLRANDGQAIDDRTADGFLRDQEEHLQQRNRAKVERVRRMVAHELRHRIGGRSLPKGVMRLMLSGFGPLLTLDYIRHGFGGQSWNQTMELVDRVLSSLGPAASGTAEERAAEEAEVVTAISRRLSNIGFSEAKLHEIVSGLLQAYLDRSERQTHAELPTRRPDEGDTEASEADVQLPTTAEGEGAPYAEASEPRKGRAQPRPVEEDLVVPPQLTPEQELHQLLFLILVPGVWCTIIDPTAGKKYWVRVKSYYPTHNSVALSHYMEERFLSLRATSFATDLVEGRAAVIDPSPELQDAIARISQIPFTRETEPLVWTTLAAPATTAA